MKDNCKLFYSIAEVAVSFGISKKSVYRLLERGFLLSSPALRRKMIPRGSIEKFVALSGKEGAK
jgi:hypothetical protein